MKKVSRLFDVQKKNQAKNNFTGVPDADPRAYFNRSTETLQDLNGTMQELEKTRKDLDQEVVMLLVALINILGHDNRGNSPIKVLLMAAYGERAVLDRPNMRVLRWRNGALSGSDVANEPGLGRSRTYEPGDMPQPTKPRPGLRRMHQDMNSEAASSSSQLRPAVPPKRARIEEVQTIETLQDLNGTMQELEKTRKELDQVNKKLCFWRCHDTAELSWHLQRPSTFIRAINAIPAPGSEVTVPYGSIDDTGRVELSQETMKKTGADNATLPAKTSEVPDRKI